jgi:hypothetical protein
MHQGEILTVVIGVTLDACGSRSPCLGVGRMKAFVLIEFIGDFSMAVKASE